MNKIIRPEDITIRTELHPGDLGYIAYLHGILYSDEYGYGSGFEVYVASGLVEFYKQFDPHRDCVWICEHNQAIIGFLLIMHRESSAQLRFFVIHPDYRGIGLGNRLMKLFMDFLKNHDYTSAFLWTTNELPTAAHLYKKYGFTLSEELPSTHLGKATIEQRYDLKL